MDDTIVDLARLRVDKSGDSRDWTVLDALRDVIADIEAGRTNPRMVYVAMEGGDDAFAVYDFQCAGGTKLEYIGLLFRHLHLTNEAGGE